MPNPSSAATQETEHGNADCRPLTRRPRKPNVNGTLAERRDIADAFADALNDWEQDDRLIGSKYEYAVQMVESGFASKIIAAPAITIDDVFAFRAYGLVVIHVAGFKIGENTVGGTNSVWKRCGIATPPVGKLGRMLIKHRTHEDAYGFYARRYEPWYKATSNENLLAVHNFIKHALADEDPTDEQLAYLATLPADVRAEAEAKAARFNNKCSRLLRGGDGQIVRDTSGLPKMEVNINHWQDMPLTYGKADAIIHVLQHAAPEFLNADLEAAAPMF